MSHPTVRPTTRIGVYIYYVGEAFPEGDVDKIMLWRNDRGYFGEITHRRGAATIPLHEYRSWGELKSNLTSCLYELQYPELIEESELRPPLLRRVPDEQ